MGRLGHLFARRLPEASLRAVNAKEKFWSLAIADVKWQLQWETVLNVSDWQVVESQVVWPLHYHLETRRDHLGSADRKRLRLLEEASRCKKPYQHALAAVQEVEGGHGLLEHIAQRCRGLGV